MKFQKLGSIILSFSFFLIVHSAYGKTCYRAHLEGTDYIQKFTSVTRNQNIYLIIKDEKVLLKAFNQDDFLNFQEQLKKVGSCSLFKDINLSGECYPIMSSEGSYVLSSDFVIFNKSEYQANWSDLSLELKSLINSRKCISVSQIQYDGYDRNNFCSLNIKNANDNRCHFNCEPEIRVSNNEKISTVEVLDTSTLYLSRYEYKKHLDNIRFYTEQKFCHKFSNFGQECEVLMSSTKKDESLIKVPNFATFKLGSFTLRAMIELSLGGVCKSWVNERKIIFNSLAPVHRHYFSFTVTGLKYQALDIISFKKLFHELKDSKIIGIQEPLTCQILKGDNGFAIKREDNVIFWSDTEVESVKAITELGKLNLCKFK